jgi:hypothetical protein
MTKRHATDPLWIDNDNEPVWLVMGAEGEDDDDTDDDTDDKDDKDNKDADDDTDDKDDDADDDRPKPKSGKAKTTVSKYVPPSQAEWNKTQAALAKANETQRATRKAALEKAKKEGQTEAATKARQEATEELEGKYVPGIIKAHAKADLVAMGCKNPSRLVRLLDTTGVTLNDDMEPVGLEAKINELKADWPEMFKTEEDTKKPAKKTTAPPAKDVDGGNKDKSATKDKKPSSAAAKLAASLTGGTAS